MGKSNSKGLFPCGSTKPMFKKDKEHETKLDKVNICIITETNLNKIAFINKENSSSNGNSCSTADCSVKVRPKLIKDEVEEVIDLSKLDTNLETKINSPHTPLSFLDDKINGKFEKNKSRFGPQRRSLSKNNTNDTSPASSLSSSPRTFDIDSFEILKVIGKGTFGKVLLVRNKLDNTIYALKCMKKLHILKTKNLTNLKNEKKVLQKVSHPFIIKLNSTFQDSNKIYFVFDYYNGGELFFHLQRYRRFDESMVRFFTSEIYLALTYLHKNGIVYRDLKPENVVLDNTGHVKLIDFGLAKDEISFQSKINTLCGTNEYIPPEVIKGHRYNFNFDWWGFGVLIYELLFGVPPFVEKTGNKAALFKKICELEPDLKYHKVKISADAEDLLKSLLNKDPSRRIKPEEIPNHPFYAAINFENVFNRKLKPPFKPSVKNQEDFSNFDPCFLRENISSPVQKLKYEIDQNKFSDF